MTDEQIIIAVAKLDGVEYHKPTEAEIKSGSYYQYEPNYLVSRDAIIPVIESQLGDNEERWSKFLHELGKLVGFHLGMEVPRWNLMKRFMFATPRQLCIALLKETNQYDP